MSKVSVERTSFQLALPVAAATVKHFVFVDVLQLFFFLIYVYGDNICDLLKMGARVRSVAGAGGCHHYLQTI